MQHILLTVAAIILSEALAANLRSPTGLPASPLVMNASSTLPTVHLIHRNREKMKKKSCTDECSQYMNSGKAGAVPYACQKKHCMPQCMWQCTDPKCEQTCTPECLAPECQTRCPDMAGQNMRDAGCRLTCVKPLCEVVCPAKTCGGTDCAECKTVCHKPLCKVVCPNAECQEVCKAPKCKFNCKNPASCPAPVCKMTCQPPDGCMKVEDGMPPLAKGMSIVDSFEPTGAAPAPGPAPGPAAAFVSTWKGAPEDEEESMSVEVVSGISAPGGGALQIEHSTIRLPVDDGCD